MFHIRTMIHLKMILSVFLLVLPLFCEGATLAKDSRRRGSLQIADDVPGETKTLILHAHEEPILSCYYFGKSARKLDWHWEGDILESEQTVDQNGVEAKITLRGLKKETYAQNFTCGANELDKSTWPSFKIFVSDSAARNGQHKRCHGTQTCTEHEEEVEGYHWFSHVNYVKMMVYVVFPVFALMVLSVGVCCIIINNSEPCVGMGHDLARESSILASESMDTKTKVSAHRLLPDIPNLHNLTPAMGKSNYSSNIAYCGSRTTITSCKDEYEAISTSEDPYYHYPQMESLRKQINEDKISPHNTANK